jgi:hypothetical protein
MEYVKARPMRGPACFHFNAAIAHGERRDTANQLRQQPMPAALLPLAPRTPLWNPWAMPARRPPGPSPAAGRSGRAGRGGIELGLHRHPRGAWKQATHKSVPCACSVRFMNDV